MGSYRRRIADLLLVALLVGCAQQGGTVRGIVVGVDGDLTAVESFTLLVEGDKMTFVPVAEVTYPFPLSHLREHLRDGTPIAVTWERSGETLLALAIADG